MRRGYLICIKGIEKLEKRNTGFQYQKYSEGIENIRRVSEMSVGYWKCLKGMENFLKK